MSIPTKTKVITWDDLAKLWNKMRNGEWNDIAPNLGRELKETWKKTVMELFTRKKKNRSYGEVTFGDVIYYMQLAVTPSEKSYKKPIDEVYIDEHTYVKFGELRFKLRQEKPWQKTEFNADGELEVSVEIPDKTYDDNIDGYRELEADRSFIKAALVLAWPRMLEKIMNAFADI